MATNVKIIDPMTAYEWLQNHEAVVVDVREPDEYKEAHIAGAYLIPIGEIDTKKLPDDVKNKKLIVHCKLGKRGHKACEKLLHENPSLDIYNLNGGITAWEDAGLSIEKGMGVGF